MMTCGECLTALSTMRLSEIRRGSPIEQHYATCENCSRVAADLQYAEHKLALALSEFGSSMPPSVVAEDAIAGAAKLRRRNAAKWFRRGLAAFGALILGTYLENRIIPEGTKIETEMVILKCTTPDVATSVVTPYLRSNGSAVYRGDNARFITLRGAHREVESAISHLDQFESRFCGAPAATPSPDVISSETYLESQVDQRATQLPGVAGPRYPEVLRAAGVEGQVRAQFVVGADGLADMQTFKVLVKTDDRFEKAVRTALPHMRFSPAKIKGQPVKQLVEQNFEFNLDR